MRKSQLPLLLLVALVPIGVLVAAGCGSGGAAVTSDAVAVVDGQKIARSELTSLLTRTKASYKQNKRQFPQPGTSEYQALQQQVVTFLVRQAEYEHVSSYFNLDNGTGKIRGVHLQGNEKVRSLFRGWLQPFADLGAETLTLSDTGGTDHLSFDAIGLPGFQFIQDPIEYGSRTHHSNQDGFDRIQPDDLKQAATIIAAFVYNAAMAEEKLPRKRTE